MRPTALRGLAPDQSLLLINGKRRHRAALVSESGPAANKGAHGPSASLIPAIAVEAIEVLRDGAAAQYGADAIAGVINLRMKDSAEGGEMALNYGQFYEGEHSFSVAANAGLPLGGDRLCQSQPPVLGQRSPLPRRAATRRPSFDRCRRGRGRRGLALRRRAPDPHLGPPGDAGSCAFSSTAACRWEGALQAYAHGNYARTEGRYRFFYRPGDNPLTVANEAHITLQTLGIEQRLPQGFTPYFDGDHTDFSVVAGLKGPIGAAMERLRHQRGLRLRPVGVLSQQQHQPRLGARQRRTAAANELRRGRSQAGGAEPQRGLHPPTSGLAALGLRRRVARRDLHGHRRRTQFPSRRRAERLQGLGTRQRRDVLTGQLRALRRAGAIVRQTGRSPSTRCASNASPTSAAP